MATQRIKLTPQQRTALVRSETAILEAEAECDRAMKVGIDCKDSYEMVQEAKRLRAALLQEYGGN